MSWSRIRASSPACSSVAVLLQRRIEAGVEQRGEIVGDRRVGGQGLLDIGLAERRADLQDVAAIGAQGHDLARAQPGGEHQAAEAVILQPAGPHAREQVLEDLADRLDLDRPAHDGLQAEIVQPVAAAVGGVDLAGLLAQHLEAHVLEHRQSVRQQHGLVAPDQLEAQQLGRVLQPPIEGHRQIAGPIARQPVDAGDVGDGRTGVDALLVGGREAGAIEVEQLVALLLARGLQERVAQAIGPAARHLQQPPLELGGIDLGPATPCGVCRVNSSRASLDSDSWAWNSLSVAPTASRSSASMRSRIAVL